MLKGFIRGRTVAWALAVGIVVAAFLVVARELVMDNPGGASVPLAFLVAVYVLYIAALYTSSLSGKALG
ncbi:TPA: hypothetical protein EYP44_05140 [Candidatus Bathyarchaeota archaeon]|nr:hypothetical protein [Candidatus Bathyarchaeota archaeon]